jgi:hypothetical protein
MKAYAMSHRPDIRRYLNEMGVDISGKKRPTMELLRMLLDKVYETDSLEGIPERLQRILVEKYKFCIVEVK